MTTVSVRGVDLLTFLALVPPELLVEGAQIEVIGHDGRVTTLTLGEPVPAPPPVFEIKPHAAPGVAGGA